MRSWADLTDKERAEVLDVLEDRIISLGAGDDCEEKCEDEPLACAMVRSDDIEACEAARAVLFATCEEGITAEAIADACEECGIHEDEAAEDVPSFIRRLRRERDLARGALVADSHNQRAQLDEYGLADEFVAHIGGDLASRLGEALVVARQERDEALARGVRLREILTGYMHPSGHARGCALCTLGFEDGERDDRDGGVYRCDEFCRVLRTALALPADRTALDALLAEARREGAGACVEAARTVFDATPSRCGADTSSSLLAAVERAAAGVGPAR